MQVIIDKDTVNSYCKCISM